MGAKTGQLQIRISPAQKAALRKRAHAAGSGVSAYVLATLFPEPAGQVGELVRALATAKDRQPVLAELNDALTTITAAEFATAVSNVDLSRLTPYLANYVAAMVEQAAAIKRVAAPAWTAVVAPLPEPAFATPLASLRLHLLTHAPAAFKRRNIFVDSTIGDRV